MRELSREDIKNLIIGFTEEALKSTKTTYTASRSDGVASMIYGSTDSYSFTIMINRASRNTKIIIEMSAKNSETSRYTEKVFEAVFEVKGKLGDIKNIEELIAILRKANLTAISIHIAIVNVIKETAEAYEELIAILPGKKAVKIVAGERETGKLPKTPLAPGKTILSLSYLNGATQDNHGRKIYELDDAELVSEVI